MTAALRIVLEIGPKGKKAVAFAPDWPGLARGATTEHAAIERAIAYLPRYAPVAEAAGLGAAFPLAASAAEVEVVERSPGTGSTDFWGISFAFSAIDRAPVPDAALERELALMRGCWTVFDGVRAGFRPS